MHTMRMATFVVLAVAMAGCKSSQTSELPQTVLVRKAHAPAGSREYDTGERHSDRIEVVVSDPRSGAAIGPSPLAQLVGQTIKVQFRRDLLGQSAGAPIPPTGQGPGGRAVSVTGTLRSVTGGWLAIEHEKTTYWIPQSSVLLIEQSDMPTTGP
jgi:hypothetical protein